MRGSIAIDLAGQTFGLLTVHARAGSKGRQAHWLCHCQCGGMITTAGSSLRGGYTRSCGCLVPISNRRLRRTHGMAESAEYRTWRHIKERCGNPANRDYKNYGARGIAVCGRWMESFANFYADMGPRPTARHTIERLNNDGPYAPDNCAWKPRAEQNANRRNTRQLTHAGATRTVQEWARLMGVDWKLIDGRLRYGWPVARAITDPLRQRSA